MLGVRLRECVGALMALGMRDAGAVFGSVDAVKLRSSLTLFEAVSGDAGISAAIEGWFGGERDARTLELLGEE